MTKFLEHRKQKRIPQKDIVVFYHADCSDGFGAPWAAWKRFGTKAQYMATFNEDKPASIKNKIIYTLDVTFPEPVTKRLIRDNTSVTSIDHHISTRDIVLMTHKPLYALNHSGSVLAWKYFFPSKPVPKFLLNIEDIDIWRKRIPGSSALYAYLDLFDFNFKIWSRLISDFEKPSKRKKMLDAGRLLLNYEERAVERRINKSARLVRFEGYEVYAVNASSFANEIGARLARMKPPFGIVWREFKNGQIGVSMRGVGNIDLSKIAQKHGGGGHKYSAAFRLKSVKDIPWQPVKIKK